MYMYLKNKKGLIDGILIVLDFAYPWLVAFKYASKILDR